MEFLSSDKAVAVAAILLVILVLLYRRFARVGSYEFPPGPVGLPILGNLLQLGELPHRTLRTLSYKYGDIMYLRLGSVPTVVVSSYEKAVLFLKTHDAVFASRPVSTAGDILFERKEVLLSPYGEYWRLMRKLCVTEMLSAKRVESFKHIRYEQTEAMVRDLWEASNHGVKPVNVSEALLRAASKVSLRMVTGRTYNGGALKMEDGFTMGLFDNIVQQAVGLLGAFNIADFIPFLSIFDPQGIRKISRPLKNRIDNIFEELIQDHLQNPLPPAHARADYAKDFVDVLLELLQEDPVNITMQNVKCMILDMYAGATQTTSTTLEWAISEVVRNPQIMRKLQQEIDTVVAQNGGKLDENSVQKMKYLHCVIKETLRLHAPGPLGIPRESMEAVTVDGFHIPNKTRVIFNLWAIATDPRVWEDAEKFDPDRFMADDTMDLTGMHPPRKMLPFTAGRRGCPGAAMAAPFLNLCLAALVFAFDWMLPHEEDGNIAELDMSESFGLAVVRKRALVLLPRLRDASRLALIHHE